MSTLWYSIDLFFSIPDVSDFVVDILQWIRIKNVFIEEDCVIVNFGYLYKKASCYFESRCVGGGVLGCGSFVDF